MSGSESDGARPFGLRIFGFPLRISPMFWLVSVMLGMPANATEYSRELFVQVSVWVVIVFVSVLWHELGHAFAMKRYGYAPTIELYGMGGRTAWGEGPPNPSAWKRVVVSVAGPGAGFILGGIVAGIRAAAGPIANPALGEALENLMWVNLGWGALNLIPMLPWDGGLALWGLLDLATKGRGRKPAAIFTIVLAVGLGIALLAARLWWPALLCGLSISVAVRILRSPTPSQVDTKLAPSDALIRAREMLEKAGPPETLAVAILLSRGSDGWRALGADLADRIGPALETPAERATAEELAAWAYLLGGDRERALATVDRLSERYEPSLLLAMLSDLLRGHFDRVIAAAPDAPEAEREAAQRIAAYAHAALSHPDRALDATHHDRELAAMIDAALFADGRFDQAAHLAALLFERFGQPTDAYNTACSHARAGRPEEGLAWLERAIDAGYTDAAQLDADDDLASVRALAAFAPLRSRLSV
ncbi:MAG: site-2 protease family protein [Sandaracinaceae bacterium]